MEFYVWFDDDHHNTHGVIRGILPDGEARKLAKQARRTTMPVICHAGGAGYSADFGLQRAADNEYYAARLLVKAACTGNAAAVGHLVSLGTARPTPAELNRLLRAERLLSAHRPANHGRGHPSFSGA